jgi:hypothetical protein
VENKHNFVARVAVLVALALTAAFAANTTTAIAQAPPGSLWYNGDFNGVGFHANGVNTSDPPSQVIGEFNVPGGPFWHVTTLFSDNLLSTVVTGAEFEIRTGGPFGTLFASGSTQTPVSHRAKHQRATGHLLAQRRADRQRHGPLTEHNDDWHQLRGDALWQRHVLFVAGGHFHYYQFLHGSDRTVSA